MRSKIRGSVILEGALVLLIVTFVIITQIELIRRIWSGLTLQLVACEAVRGRILGLELVRVETEVQSLLNLLSNWTSDNNGRINVSRDEYKIASVGDGISKFHVRYPALLSFREKPELTKVYFEVTEQCRFPFLLH